MIKIPDIDEKIYDILISYMDVEWKNEDKEYLKSIVDDTLESMDLSVDKICNDIMIGVDNGYSVSYQLELIDKMLKTIFKKD